MNPNTEPEILEPEPLHFEDLFVGDRWVSPKREISGDDVADFAQLTGDHTSLHGNQAEDSPFGKPVAHGLLGLGILAGLSSEHPRIATRAFVSISDWDFLAPVFFGDTVHVVTEVESVERHGRKTGRVTWVRQLINQDGRVVQHGRFVTLVSARVSTSRPVAEVRSQRGTLPAR